MFADVPLAEASHMVQPRLNARGAQRSDSLGPLLIHVKHRVQDWQKKYLRETSKEKPLEKTYEDLSERKSKTSRKQSF